MTSATVTRRALLRALTVFFGVVLVTACSAAERLNAAQVSGTGIPGSEAPGNKPPGIKQVTGPGRPYHRHGEVALWQGSPPIASRLPGAERFENERVYNVRVPKLYPYLLPSSTPRPAVVVFPGGAYQKLSMVKEGEEAANWLNSLGIQAFVVKSRLQEFGAPAPLLDAQQAIRMVRHRALAWKVDPARIGVLGFSAGGHLAASLSQYFDASLAEQTRNPLAGVSAKPDFAMLVYPVTTLKLPHTHLGSVQALLGKTAAPKQVAYYSFDNALRPDSPKTLLIHSAKDASVAAENSVQYWQGLRAAGVGSELHVFQHGGHGFGLRDTLNPIGQWPEVAKAWMVDNSIAPAAPAVQGR